VHLQLFIGKPRDEVPEALDWRAFSSMYERSWDILTPRLPPPIEPPPVAASKRTG
jgi:hypothetical protein